MRTITYTFSVTATTTIDEDAGEDTYTDRKETVQLEREVIRAVKESKRLDFGEVDAECMEYQISDVKP